MQTFLILIVALAFWADHQKDAKEIERLTNKCVDLQKEIDRLTNH